MSTGTKQRKPDTSASAEPRLTEREKLARDIFLKLCDPSSRVVSFWVDEAFDRANEFFDGLEARRGGQ